VTYVIGVDPGLSGGIAILKPNKELYDIYDIPQCPKSANKNWVDANKLHSILYNLKQETTDIIAIIEQVHSMPGQGVASMFTFGEGLGCIRGVLVANGIPIEWVSPQKWKKHFNLTKEKKVATAKVCNLYPQHTELFITPRGKCLDGRAEALLIGRWYLETKTI
jgi:crossover junction endodeoxyribonuclease RuvC